MTVEEQIRAHRRLRTLEGVILLGLLLASLAHVVGSWIAAVVGILFVLAPLVPYVRLSRHVAD